VSRARATLPPLCSTGILTTTIFPGHLKEQSLLLLPGLPGPEFPALQVHEEFSDIGECEKDLCGGKNVLVSTSGYQSVVMEFSDGKLKQKGFFHSAPTFLLPA
jgi:hypothetical protein